MRDFYALVALALAGFVAGTIGQEFYRGIRARRRMHGESAPLAFARLIGRNRRRYGGYIVHAGILIYFVAFAGMAFRRQQEATLKPGESVEMQSPFGHSYRFTHLGISQYEALNRVVSAATVEVTKDGRRAGLMTSEKRQHVDSFNRPTFEPSTEVAIRSNLQEDVYMVFAGAVNGTEEAVYRFNLNPLVWWVWFGGLVLVFGGIITMWPGGGPVVSAPRRKQAGYQVELVGTGGRLDAVRSHEAHSLPPRLPRLAGSSRSPSVSANSKSIPWPAAEPLERCEIPTALGRSRQPTDARENSAEIQAIEEKLACNCGCTLDVFTCRTTDFSCTYSPALHREVLALRDQGKSAREILDAFVQKYGEKALMAPKPKGFNLWGYLLPGAAVATAGIVLAAVLKRREAVQRAPEVPPPVSASADELDRLKAALAEVED